MKKFIIVTFTPDGNIGFCSIMATSKIDAIAKYKERVDLSEFGSEYYVLAISLDDIIDITDYLTKE